VVRGFYSFPWFRVFVAIFIILMKNWFHGGNLREAAEKSGISPEDILDFSANINPLGLPIGLKKLIRENLSEILRYPDPECKLLKKEISQYLNVDDKRIILENGSTPLIYLFVQKFSPKKVLIVTPTFSEYERALRIHKSKISFFQLKEKNKFEFKLKELVEFMDGTDALFLCNPNNPTGTIIPREKLMEIVRLTGKKNIFLFLDEAFIDYQEEESLKKFVGRNLFILRSFTKFFAIPGLRLGYGLGNKELVQKLNKIRAPWSVNGLAQIAAIFLLQDKQFIKKSREFMKKERIFFFNELAKISGLKPFSPKANFILVKLLKNSLSASCLQKRLLKKKILIRDCTNIRGLNNSFIRVAVKNRTENQRLIEVLEKTV